jgi:TolA-binding protein
VWSRGAGGSPARLANVQASRLHHVAKETATWETIVSRRWLAPLLVGFAIAVLAMTPRAQTQQTPDPKARGDLQLVQKLLTARKEYQKALEQLYVHYHQVTDKERERWAKEELIQFHRVPKHAFILDLVVPPPNLNGNQNVQEANRLFTWAMEKFKDKGYGTDYIDNQRRAELVFQEILTKYPQSDKISDVAFMLGDIYESKAYRMYYLAVEYYHRCYQWNPRTSLEARLRAARIYDRHLQNRNKAVEVYREVTTHETDPRRIQEAQKRLAELSGTK